MLISNMSVCEEVLAQTVSGPVTAARMEPAVTMTTRAVCVPRGGRDSSVTRPAHWGSMALDAVRTVPVRMVVLVTM